MKKLLLVFLFALVLVIAGCADTAASEKLASENEALRKEIEALKNGTPPISAIAENKAETTMVKKEIWEVRYYVDEFKLPTDTAYISTKDDIMGVFSNTATTNSKVYVRFLIDDRVCIMLYEYGSNIVKNASSRNYESYDILMRTAGDVRTKMTGEISPDGNRIVIDSTYYKSIIKALSGSEDVDFYIEQVERKTTNYLFTVETANFADVYKSFGG